MSKNLQETIRQHYAKHAVDARKGKKSCGCSGEGIGSRLYDRDQLSALSAEVAQASAGCGNPTALANLRLGEQVLDLGSGGGIDVFLAAKQVGSKGRAIGLDMTPEMLSIARENASRMGVSNVEFLQGEIEQIPLPDSSVDVILSNCVINLSADKDQVFRETFRVLQPGGRLAISDMMWVGDRALLPAQVRDSMDSWASCIAGALEIADYQAKIMGAGFEDVSIQITNEHELSASDDCCGSSTGSSSSSCCSSSASSCCSPAPTSKTSCCSAPSDCSAPSGIGVKLVSGFVRAYKPNPEAVGLPVSIEPAEATDLPEIYGLLSQHQLPLDGLTDHLDSFLVARRGPRIIGVGGLEVYGSYALLRSLAVTKSMVGDGIGSSLMRALLELATGLGVKQLCLLTTTARDYFPKWGFLPISRAEVPIELQQSVEFQGACPVTATVMRLKL